jgi:hypothetical protein
VCNLLGCTHDIQNTMKAWNQKLKFGCVIGQVGSLKITTEKWNKNKKYEVVFGTVKYVFSRVLER